MKIAICIPTCWKRSYTIYGNTDVHLDRPNDRVEWIRQTWLRDAKDKIDVRFFYGRGATRDPIPDEVFLDCDDGYIDVFDKAQGMFKWALAAGNPPLRDLTA